MKSTLTVSILFCVVSYITLAAANNNTRDRGNLDWWKHCNLYQIYPRSFKDSDNDGIGDLRGIIDKIDHFPKAGVDAVWLSPIFKSPQVDHGYDISNYTDIEPDYGTIDDVEELTREAHKRGIKVIFDFVPSYTSDQHQFFLNSVNGVEEYRDYYVWANGKTDENGNRVPPNNWISIWKNSAWTWNEERQQYYYHQYTPAQPELNYRNPKVVEDMKNVMRFWMDRGIDGFRIDSALYIFEDENLRDEPLSSNSSKYTKNDYEYLNHIYTQDLPETIDMVYQWRKVVDDYTHEHGGDQRVIMTEVYTDPQTIMLYYGTPDGSQLGAHFTFNFNLISYVNINSTAGEIVDTVNQWLDAIPEIYTSNWVIGNHDRHRVATRFGPANVDGFNMLKSLLPGAAVTYNGEEIGQEDGEVSFEEGQDPAAPNSDTFDAASRDFVRTPFQWDDSINAGFNTGAKPWLPVSEKYLETNLKKQEDSQGLSHFKIYQELSKIRNHSVVISGSTEIKNIGDEVVFLKRNLNGYSIVLIFNRSDNEVTVDVEGDVSSDNKVVIASVDSSRVKDDVVSPKKLKLEPHEAIIVGYLEH